MSTRPGFTLRAKKVAGKTSLDRGRFRRLWARLSDGEWDLTVEKHVTSRSRQLEKYLWSHVYQELSEHTGYTRDELHAYFKGEFLTKQTKPIVLADEYGEVKREGQIVVPTTTVLTNEEYSDYIKRVRQAAAELGVVTHDPDPEWMFNEAEKPKAKRFNKKDEAA